MTDSWCLVVNPAAGNGRARRLLPRVLGALAEGVGGSGAAGASSAPGASGGTGGLAGTGGAGGPPGVQVCETSSLGHAARLALDAAGRGEKVVAVGGDGLVGAVAAGLADVGGVFGIIPAGRGNDFARMLGIPFRTADAARVLRTGQPRKIDLIGVRAGDGPEQVVAGSVYLGIPSEGGDLANRSRIPGSSTVKYKIAGVRATLAYRPTTFTVEPDPAGPPHSAGGTDPADGRGSAGEAAAGGSRFTGQAVVVANSGYFAAGTLAAPAADVADGLLDLIMVSGEQRLAFLRVMLAAGRGTHLRLDQVSTLRAPAVTVTADRAMLAGADGETLTHASPLPAGSALRVRAVPAAVQVLSPVPIPASGRRGRTGAPQERAGGGGSRAGQSAADDVVPRQAGTSRPPARYHGR